MDGTNQMNATSHRGWNTNSQTHTRIHTQQPPTPPTTAEEAEGEGNGDYPTVLPPFFTDKLVAWDAAAPLGQDFALAVQG